MTPQNATTKDIPLSKDPHKNISLLAELLQKELFDLPKKEGSPQKNLPILALTGSVASGKTSLSRQLMQEWEAKGVRLSFICTDAFLYDNTYLQDHGLSEKKGFPVTYNTPLLLDSLARIKTGESIRIPVYDHTTYDILPHAEEEIDGSVDLLLLEGLNILPILKEIDPRMNQRIEPRIEPRLEQKSGQKSPTLIDLSLYLDADESLLQEWFLTRFETFFQESRGDTESIYQKFFGDLSDEERFARGLYFWQEINLVNLRQHLAPHKHETDYLLRKGESHHLFQLQKNTKNTPLSLPLN